MQSILCRVESNERETEDVYTIRLSSDGQIKHKIGQYIIVSTPYGTTPYSICTTNHDSFIELCIKKIEGGKISNYICSLKKGDTLVVKGPAGNFELKEPVENEIIFMATGTGISPLRAMIRRIFELGVKKDVWLFFGARTEKEIIWRLEFEALQKQNKNFHYVPVLSREEWNGEKGYVQAVMKRKINPEGKDFYIAGVKTMVEQSVNTLKEMGVKDDFIHTEKFV